MATRSDSAADVGRLEDVAQIVDRTIAAFGGIDLLVNNAGITGRQPVGSYTVEEWQRIFDINVRGPVFLLQEALPHLKEKSTWGGAEHHLDRRLPELTGLSHLRLEQGGPPGAHSGRSCRTRSAWHSGERLVPGPFDTDLIRQVSSDPQKVGQATLLKRVAHPDEAVGPALLLTSDAGSFITGQVLFVDGGYVVAR